MCNGKILCSLPADRHWADLVTWNGLPVTLCLVPKGHSTTFCSNLKITHLARASREHSSVDGVDGVLFRAEFVGYSCSVVNSVHCIRRVAGSNPTLAAM